MIKRIIFSLSIFWISCVDTKDSDVLTSDTNNQAGQVAAMTAGSITAGSITAGSVTAASMTAGSMIPMIELLVAPNQLKIASYNVENLFDLINDAHDEREFTPGPTWTAAHYEQKLQNIAQAIFFMNADIIGLVEVESLVALDDLNATLESQYQISYPYRAISPTRDIRGIRPAIMSKYPFVNAVHRPINSEYLCANQTLLNGSKPEARYVFQVDFQFQGETLPSLTVLVNHWKSRAASNEPCKVTEHQRRSGQFVHQLAENLKSQNPLLNLVVLGDFNAIENEMSIYDDLDAKTSRLDLVQPDDFYNLWGELNIDPGQADATTATYYFDRQWFRLDHIIINQAFLNTTPGKWGFSSFELIRNLNLLVDGRPMGWNNTRITGYSDHLPVTATFFRR
jgi:predicted extracellular nuclease